MIEKQKIREAVRRRIIAASGINPLTQFQEENKDFDSQGLDFWIAEYCIGGKETMISPKRSRVSAFIMQYDLFAPLNSGIAAIDAALAQISAEFDLSDPQKSSVDVPGYAVNITSIKSENDSGKYWQRVMLVLTLDIVKS